MEQFVPTIGLEIHAELNTRSKMFCSCANDPDEATPNINMCPVCLAHPGTLPVINREAVHKVLLVGAALGATLAERAVFDRKNYFYPDLPKGYQISQFPYPLVAGGSLAGVQITRVHLEEDTARSSHEGDSSLIDFNRAGAPLMELVTDPVIHSAQEAGIFARELQLLLRYLKASEANLEKGEMRVEANISVSSGSVLGTKVEVKNLNSFRSVERAIAYEVERQIAALRAGEPLVQETRGWDDQKQRTFTQRKKESSHDYRYFPEPDLPILRRSNEPGWTDEKLQAELPELPSQRRARYAEIGLRPEDADVLVRNEIYAAFFDRVNDLMLTNPNAGRLAVLAANYTLSDIAGKLENGDMDVSWLLREDAPIRFAELMRLVQENKLSSRGAKDVLSLLIHSDESAETLARSNKLLQESSETAIEEVVRSVMIEQKAAVSEYRTGKRSSLQFLIGEGMKKTRGSANPLTLKLVFERLLEQGN